MGFVRQHWFGFIVTLVLLLSALLFLIVLFSPRQDNQKRGFIPCTETMAAALYDCRGRSFCMLGAILENSRCDAADRKSTRLNSSHSTSSRMPSSA